MDNVTRALINFDRHLQEILGTDDDAEAAEAARDERIRSTLASFNDADMKMALGEEYEEMEQLFEGWKMARSAGNKEILRKADKQIREALDEIMKRYAEWVVDNED